MLRVKPAGKVITMHGVRSVSTKNDVVRVRSLNSIQTRLFYRLKVQGGGGGVSLGTTSMDKSSKVSKDLLGSRWVLFGGTIRVSDLYYFVSVNELR